MTKHRVPETLTPVRLSRYLSRAWPLTPDWVFRDALRKRDVRVDGVKAAPDTLVSGGQELTLYVPERHLTGEVNVLFEDGALLALEKPPGLPVDVDAEGVGADTLLARARRAYPTARLVHRLDAGTCGVMLLALTDDMEARLTAAFEAHTPEKIYHALCVGKPNPARGTLTHYLQKDASGAKVRVFDRPVPGALTAVCDYETLADWGGGVWLVEVCLRTGRTHQIRAQMARIGCPLAGDDKYGDRAANKALGVNAPQLWCQRTTLHMEGYEGARFESAPAFRLQKGR